MVNLKVGQSSFDAKTQPFTTKWDLSMRQYHKTYQAYIDQSHYRLQKALKGLPIFGSSNFPGHFQHKYLLLELYQKKQLLGEVEASEVDAYAKIHPEIRQDLGFTFSPHKLENYYPGLAAAGGIHLFGHVANINFSYRIGYALIALSLNALYNMYRVQPIFNTIQFLDYTTQARVARSRAEIETGEGKTYLLENAASFKGLQNKAGLTDIKQAYRELFAL